MKSCCVIGHRDIPAGQVEYVKQALRKEIMCAIADGYTYFYSGFAEGTDLYFAAIIAEIKRADARIKLEAVIPYRGRLETKSEPFCSLIAQCNTIGVHSEAYSPTCFLDRNRWIVGQVERVIAVYDGLDMGGTLSTMRYALALRRDVRVIELGTQCK